MSSNIHHIEAQAPLSSVVIEKPVLSIEQRVEAIEKFFATFQDFMVTNQSKFDELATILSQKSRIDAIELQLKRLRIPNIVTSQMNTNLVSRIATDSAYLTTLSQSFAALNSLKNEGIIPHLIVDPTEDIQAEVGHAYIIISSEDEPMVVLPAMWDSDDEAWVSASPKKSVYVINGGTTRINIEAQHDGAELLLPGSPHTVSVPDAEIYEGGGGGATTLQMIWGGSCWIFLGAATAEEEENGGGGGYD